MVGKRGNILITCQNSDCAYYLIEEGKDIIKNGRNPAGNQQYHCNHCKKYFIETLNTPFYRSQLPRSDILQIAKHSVEKTSIRGISRISGHHQDTIARYMRKIGDHARKLNEHYTQEIPVGNCEFDEIWSFVQKKQEPQSK